MKTYLYGLIALFIFFLGVANEKKIPLNDSKNQVSLRYVPSKKGKTELFNVSDTIKYLQDLSDLLSLDYQDLVNFSGTILENGISEENFGQLFWDGAIKSFNFYHSSEHIGQSSINQLIEKDLRMNSNLGHALEKPSKSKTTVLNTFKSLNQFSGEWHGMWRNMGVHHLWLPVREFKKVITYNFSLIGFQSCFTGDGFGWNYVVKEKNRIIVLGYVYHFNNDGKISSKNPHYAFLNPNNQLTWVSDNHIYYEFVCSNSNCIDKKHYVITGAEYEKQSKKLKLVSGFQAIYLSEDNQLPAFKHLYINKLNRVKSFLSKKLVTVLKNIYRIRYSSF